MISPDQERTLDHIVDLIDQRADATWSAEGVSDSEELETLRVAAQAGRCLYQESDKVKEMEQADWQRFAARHRSVPVVETSQTQSTQLSRSAYFLHPHFVWGALSGVAASVLVCFVCAWMWWNFKTESTGVVVYKAVTTDSQVVLTTSNGANIALTEQGEADSQALTDMGISLHAQEQGMTDHPTGERLDYSSDATMKSHPIPIEQHVVTVPHGKDFSLHLADGTAVYLNAESRLEYPSRFEGAERIVRLTGEAYFEVAKDAEHPFIVQTSDLETRVLGTSFVVRDYEEQSPVVALVEGSVMVSSRTQPDNHAILQPGQIVELATDGMLIMLDEDIDQYTYWRSGYFYYDEKELSDIMTELGRWYNVNIVFESEALMHLKLHYFCNRHENLDEAIRILNYQPNLNIHFSDNTVYIH